MKREIDYRGAIRRGWWLILLLIVVTLGATVWFTSRQQPVYETSAMLVVAPSPETTEPAEIVRSLDTLERRTVVATFARIPTTREAREALAERLGLELRGVRINGSVVPNTNIIRISAVGPKADVVAAAANGAAELTMREASALYRIYSLHSLETASVPRSPSYPDPQRNLVVGAILGLVLGLAAALGLDRLKGSGRTPGES